MRGAKEFSRGTAAVLVGALVLVITAGALLLSLGFGYNEGKGGPALWHAILIGASLVGAALIGYGLWARRQDARLYGGDG